MPVSFKARWTTDDACVSEYEVCGPLGADGPWQAVLVHLRELTDKTTQLPGYSVIPFYPTSQYTTNVSSELYNPDVSTRANPNSSKYERYEEPWSLHSAQSENIPLNTTFWVTRPQTAKTFHGSKHEILVGSLGLGKVDAGVTWNGKSGLLPELKSHGLIPSSFFSLHIGSAGLKLPGSLVLGGYEQNRVLGDVGVFHGSESLFLVDVMLGVEEGGSPFGNETGIVKGKPKSVWQGLGGDEKGETMTKSSGGPAGSAVMYVRPNSPYIELPIGNCEAISKYIPVNLRKDINYYVWNVHDPQYQRLVSSPAYLSFIFSDQDVTNLTIKIPFALLDLTLTSPIVNTSTPYFPCRSSAYPSGGWTLGRAFLQAAFYSVDFETDKNVILRLAQGPGPSLEQAIRHSFGKDRASIRSNPADSFAKTWRPHWQVLPEDPAQNQTGERTSQTDYGTSLGKPKIAAIIVGSLLGAVVLAAVIFYIWRQQTRSRQKEHTNGHEDASQVVEVLGEGRKVNHELSAEEMRHEMPVPPEPQELEGSVPAIRIPSPELPATELAAPNFSRPSNLKREPQDKEP